MKFDSQCACVYDKHHFTSISDSCDCQFWANNIVIFVHDYNIRKNSIFVCTKNRSELAIAYPDELTGAVPQAKKGWGYKNVSE